MGTILILTLHTDATAMLKLRFLTVDLTALEENTDYF